VKNQDFMDKKNFFLSTLPLALGQFQPHGCM
jgi:hypothetical protein